MASSKSLYKALLSLQHKDGDIMDEVQQRLVRIRLRNMRHGGVELVRRRRRRRWWWSVKMKMTVELTR